MGYRLGVDLGTTYSAAAVCRSAAGRWVEPEVVTLGSRAVTLPSVLYIGDDGSVLVGEAAERRAVTDPDRVVREFKRRIGDPTPVVVAGRPWAAEDFAARLVRWIVDQVAAREGGPADRIAVTHPASWGSHKKDLFAAALAAHGLEVSFLAEPQAAALHYASAERVGTGSTIAVYDLGGGTFDAAVVRKGAAGQAGFGLLGCPEGIAQLGGVDFDQAVFDHVVAGMPGAFDSLDDTDPAVLGAVARLRRECTEAKEVLSADTEASVPVLLPGTQGSVRLHRSEFEQMIGGQIEETVDALRRAVESAGLIPEQLSAVLLVGGSSRIPLVAQLVSEQLGRPVAVDADPENAIAKGAALAVADRPIASWPEVAIAPVEVTGPVAPVAPVAAGVAGAGAVALMSASAPMPAWADAPTVHRSGQAPTVHRSGQAPAAGSPMPPPMPPPRPRVSSIPEWNYDEQPAPKRRGPVGLLVGAGGVLAVAAVIVAVLTWPTAAPLSAGAPVSGRSTVDAPAAPGADPVSPVANPVTQQQAPVANNGSRPSPGPSKAASKPAAGAPVAPAVPVVVAPPVTNPPVTNPPVTDPPPPVTDPPPPVTDPPPPVTDPPPPVTSPAPVDPPPSSEGDPAPDPAPVTSSASTGT